MLNWRLEEREYVGKKIEEYYKSITALQRIFISEKQMNKNINYITEQAELSYRERKLNDYINVHHVDALEIDVNDLSEYDIIFIDAAKAQNIKFFEKFSPLLKPNGVIITDNLQFHGTITDLESQSKNVRKMVEKIDKYNHYLNELSNYHTIFINVGDGISITRRIKDETNM